MRKERKHYTAEKSGRHLLEKMDLCDELGAAAGGFLPLAEKFPANVEQPY